MFYGESPKDKNEVGNFARNNRAYVHEKLEIISNLTIEYMKNQKKSGADCLQIFDSWGGLIKEDYNEWRQLGTRVGAGKMFCPIF